jgi:hypothetical protein
MNVLKLMKIHLIYLKLEIKMVKELTRKYNSQIQEFNSDNIGQSTEFMH